MSVAYSPPPRDVSPMMVLKGHNASLQVGTGFFIRTVNFNFAIERL